MVITTQILRMIFNTTWTQLIVPYNIMTSFQLHDTKSWPKIGKMVDVVPDGK